MRAPYISAESTSRPCSSVPSRYLAAPPSIHEGGSIESLSSSVARSVGLCGATTPAKTAQKMQASATAAEPIAIGEPRKECQKSPSRKRAQRPGAGPLGALPRRRLLALLPRLADGDRLGGGGAGLHLLRRLRRRRRAAQPHRPGDARAQRLDAAALVDGRRRRQVPARHRRAGARRALGADVRG